MRSAELARSEEKRLAQIHHKALTVRYRPGPQGTTELLPVDGTWVRFDFTHGWREEDIVVATGLARGDYAPGVLESPEANAPDVQLVIQEK